MMGIKLGTAIFLVIALNSFVLADSVERYPKDAEDPKIFDIEETDTRQKQHADCECDKGQCVKKNGKTVCQCPPGYGNYTSTKCKECNCGKDSNCTFESYGFLGLQTRTLCICKKGYKAQNEKCIGPCSTNPCINGGTCVDVDKGYKCDCTQGYSGPKCEKKFDPCGNKPCQNNGKCTVDGSSYKCKCVSPWNGKNCTEDACTSKPCQNNGKCTVDGSSYKCKCVFPWNGKNCTEEEAVSTRPPTTVPTVTNMKTSYTTVNFTVFTETTNELANFTDNLNSTTSEPFNFTTDVYDSTTHEPTSFTGDFNKTSYQSTTITGDFNKTSYQSTTITGDFNKTSYQSTTITGDLNGTSHQPTTITSDFNSTTYSTSIVTYGTTLNETTDELLNTTHVDITGSTVVTVTVKTSTDSETSNYTHSTIPDKITTSTTDGVITSELFSTFQPITITTHRPDPKLCGNYSCENGGKCIDTDERTKECQCVYPHGGENCTESHWCTLGMGRALCAEEKCQFNFTSMIGSCECSKNQYYNYEEKECKDIDKCPLMLGKCTGEREVCLKGACECETNFQKINNKCVPNFCKSKPSPCGENELCEEVENNPGNVKCTCMENYFFDGEICKEGNNCTLPSPLGCDQICNPENNSCECEEGFILQPDKKKCKLAPTYKTCQQKCGVGTCVVLNGTELCICPITHHSLGNSCIDRCSAKLIPEGLCPNDECMADEKLGYKCKCEGKMTYEKNGVTCRRKLMCTEGNGNTECSKKNAFCVEDYNSTAGYKCECQSGEEMDGDRPCTKKCDLLKYQELCSRVKATCDMDGDHVSCKCLPLRTFGTNGECTELAKESYTGIMPLEAKKYLFNKALSPVFMANETTDAVDYENIRKDLRDSMRLLYGENYKFADVLNCKYTGGNLNCVIELQFKSDPKDQVKMIGDAEICLSDGSDTCFIPPRLLLKKKDMKPGMFAETDQCQEDIKSANCGPVTKCSKLTGKNYECSCLDGFKSFGFYQPLSDARTIIHTCQDIDECLIAKACPNRTRCFNTPGSYECLCQTGFKTLTATSDPKVTNCIGICDDKICKHGKCEVSGNAYRCLCDKGYMGLNCDQDEVSVAGSESMRIALIILSVVVVPLILVAAFVTHKYRLLKKETSQSSYLDDNSSQINLEPIRS